MNDFSNAPKEEVIQILLQNISDLEKVVADMNEAEFGSIDIQPAGIVMSGNEAKRIVELLRKSL